MTRTQRVYLIIQMLNQRPWTVAEMADHFNVARRTIQADLLLIRSEPFYQNVYARLVYTIVPVCA